ncbi:MAG: DUF2244 domain-containing protein [Candidatus Competibacterales bacterium]
MWFFLAVCCVSLTIAVGFAALGLWLVLPFAGLELTALGICLYGVVHRSYRREVISLTAEWVEVERGQRGPRERQQLPRLWTRVDLDAVPGRTTSRLQLRFRDRCVEVGGFLREDERRQLAADLRQNL